MTREEFIKRKIREKGMTLKDYARSINMPYSTLLSMLAGNLGGASLDNVVRICNGLDTSIGTMQSAYMDGGLENNVTDLSEREKKLVLNYRVAGVLQEAIDKLLDLKSSSKQKLSIGPAARRECGQLDHVEKRVPTSPRITRMQSPHLKREKSQMGCGK